MSKLTTIYADLADQFLAAFPEEIALPRTVGREVELPIVTATGEAADVRRLLIDLATDGNCKLKYDTGTANLLVEVSDSDHSYASEVGLGTLEINTHPCHTLFEAQEIIERAVRRVVRLAARYGWLVLGYGIQPVSPPTLALMTPKQRYQSLYRAMGGEWLWYTVTASDQTQLAITRNQAIDMLNYGNLITPIIIALCANSPVYEGQLSHFCSGREGQHLLIQANEHRHGMPVRPFVDAYDFVERMCQITHLIHRLDNTVIPVVRPFSDYLMEHGADYPAFLFHEHYVWNSARIRAAYGTIEIRPACQQPWSEHMAAMALTVGLIEGASQIEQFIRQGLGMETWQRMLEYHQLVIRYGLLAPQPVPGFLDQIVGLAAEGLRGRGQGEETLLQPIFDRLYRRQNPAQRARAAFQNDGMAGLLRHTAIH